MLAGELLKRQIEANDKMLLQNDIRKAQQIEHDYLEVQSYYSLITALLQPREAQETNEKCARD